MLNFTSFAGGFFWEYSSSLKFSFFSFGSLKQQERSMTCPKSFRLGDFLSPKCFRYHRLPPFFWPLTGWTQIWGYSPPPPPSDKHRKLAVGQSQVHLLLLHLLHLLLLPLQSVGGAEHYCLPAAGTQLPPLPLSTNERLSLPTLQWEEAPLV